VTDTGKRNWQILAVVLTGSLMAVLDTTIVNVALPSIEQGAHASSDALEWVVSGYALAFGLALVPAGRVGDRYGYKRLFLAGLSLFTLASGGCGVAQSSGELIVARLVQGLGAGIYYPAISAIIQRLFSGKDRSRAFGYLGGADRRDPPPGCSAFLSWDLEAAGEPRRPGYGPGGEQPPAAARSGSCPLRADAHIAVRVLAWLRRDHGKRPRQDAHHRVAGAGLRRRAPR
jgi:hypothetical protein